MKNIFQVKTLYYKYFLDEEWSVRYHLIFKDRRRYQYKWILKSHFSKEHIFITKEEADSYIETYSSSPKLILGFMLHSDYRKIEINNIGDLNFYIDSDDTPKELLKPIENSTN